MSTTLNSNSFNWIKWVLIIFYEIKVQLIEW
jgi:hypothetical protein